MRIYDPLQSKLSPNFLPTSYATPIGASLAVTTLSGCYSSIAPMLPHAQAILFGIGTMIATYGGYQFSRTLFANFAAKKISQEEKPDEEKLKLHETLSDIETHFQSYLSLLMLADEKHLTENMRLYRAEYENLKTQLEKLSVSLTDQINGEWAKVSLFAQAFNVEVKTPDPIDNHQDWEKVFSDLASNKRNYLPEDWASLLHIKEEILPGLFFERSALKEKAEKLGIIIAEDFPKMEREALDSFRTHRTLVDNEEAKFKARQALKTSHDTSYAMIARSEELNKIADTFIEGFYKIMGDVKARLNAVTVAEHPELESKISEHHLTEKTDFTPETIEAEKQKLKVAAAMKQRISQ